MLHDYLLHELTPYVNWVFFYFAWGIKAKYAECTRIVQEHDCPACRQQWVMAFKTEEEQTQAKEALRLYDDARMRLRELEAAGVKAHCTFVLCPAYSEGDNIVITKENGESCTLPFMRQLHTDPSRPNLCLSDFIAPKGYEDARGVANRLGFFSTTVDDVPEISDPYDRMLTQTLLDRMAEAAAEKWHEAIRKAHWGYAPNEQLSIAEMLEEKYQGIRPAVGYPSIPDQSFNFLLYDIIPMREIGVRLTENGMMQPHASVSGLLFAHPKAHYFAIGSVSDEQLTDYAHRRGSTLEAMRKYVPN